MNFDVTLDRPDATMVCVTVKYFCHDCEKPMPMRREGDFIIAECPQCHKQEKLNGMRWSKHGEKVDSAGD